MAARPTSAALGSRKSFTKDLDKEVINSMHKTLLGGERDLPPAWGSQGLTFREQGMRCGLLQHEGGPCGVLAAVQAHVLRQLLLDPRTPASLSELPREAAGEALIAALAHIIWSARMGRLANVVVCKKGVLPPLREAVGELFCTECKSADDVATAVRAGIGAFMKPPGVRARRPRRAWPPSPHAAPDRPRPCAPRAARWRCCSTRCCSRAASRWCSATPTSPRH